MSPDVLTQVRSYYERLDTAQEPIRPDEIEALLATEREPQRVDSVRGGPRTRLLVLVAIIAVIGGVAALVIAANGGNDAGVVVTDDADPEIDGEGLPDRVTDDADPEADRKAPPDLEGVSVRDLMWVEVVLDADTFGDSPQLIAAAASDSMVVVGGAAGDDAALWTSTDRTSWTRVPHDAAVFGGDGQVTVEAIVPWGAGFVAAGQTGKNVAVWISEDGLTWERIPHDRFVFGGPGEQRVHSIAASDARLVIVGFDEADDDNEPAVWTSSDGRNWRQEPTFGDTEGEIFDVIATEDGFVGVGSDVWESTDGAEWERVYQVGPGLRMTIVEAVPDGFVAVSNNPAVTSSIVWTASEISTWTRAAELLVPGLSTAAVAAGDSGLVAISGGEAQRAEQGGAQMFVSEDGTTWESAASLGLLSESAFASLNIIREGHAITAFGPNFVAVGWQFEESSTDGAVPIDSRLWTTVDPTGSEGP